jgi:hypothetical protein
LRNNIESGSVVDSFIEFHPDPYQEDTTCPADADAVAAV